MINTIIEILMINITIIIIVNYINLIDLGPYKL